MSERETESERRRFVERVLSLFFFFRCRLSRIGLVVDLVKD